LAETAPDSAERELMRKQVAETLDLLEPIESYWAFPGRRGFEHLVALFHEQDFGAFSDLVHRIGRALSSQSYRRKFVSLQLDDEEADGAEERRESEERGDRP